MEQKEIDEIVEGILQTMKGQVVSVIMFGSRARGDYDEESDVDIALIFNGEKTKEQEELLLAYFVDMDLKYNKVFSIIDIQNEEFEKWRNVSPFYKNIVKEGIVLWKAA